MSKPEKHKLTDLDSMNVYIAHFPGGVGQSGLATEEGAIANIFLFCSIILSHPSSALRFSILGAIKVWGTGIYSYYKLLLL